MTKQDAELLYIVSTVVAQVLIRMPSVVGSDFVNVMQDAKKMGIVEPDWTDLFF